MVTWSQLLLPIALSAVFIFIVSSLIHMVLKWHNPDYKKLGNEEEVRAALRKGSSGAGQYMIPYCTHDKSEDMAEVQRKFVEGPVGMLILRQPGPMKLGAFLMQWVLYTLVIGVLVGYVAQFTLKPGAYYMDVFRLVGTTAWLAYAWQGPSDAIWKGAPWASTIKYMIDGLVYALLTAGTFAWLWPR